MQRPRARASAGAFHPAQADGSRLQADRDYLEAGESATVTVTVRNTSSSQKVHNIKLSFNAEWRRDFACRHGCRILR